MITREDYITIANIITETNWYDESSVIKGGFHVTQFQGTIFMSDYQCFKVEYNGGIMVAKITSKSEYLILELLKKDGFSVPDPILYLVGGDSQKILLFEQFLLGSELSSDSSKEVWQSTAIQLAKLHLKYWENYESKPMYQQGAILYQEKLRKVINQDYFRLKWGNIIQKIVLRFEEAPHTVVHGDAFPTNFLVHDMQVSFIDLANVGIMPYMVDVARLTCLPSLKEEALICPYKENVLDAYYNEIQQQINLSKESFLIDVKLASFVELAAIYIPPIGINAYSLSYQSKENKTVERMLYDLGNNLR